MRALVLLPVLLALSSCEEASAATSLPPPPEYPPMPVASLGPGSLHWHTFHKMWKELGTPPISRTLPFPPDQALQQNVRIEPDFGYFVATGIQSPALPSTSPNINLSSGNRRITSGLVAQQLLVGSAATQIELNLGWPRPIYIRPGDFMRMSFASALAAGNVFVLSGMYGPPGWTPSNDELEMRIATASIIAGTGADKTTIQFASPGLIYDLFITNLGDTSLLATTSVIVYLNNTSQPLYEGPVQGNALGGIVPNLLAQTLYPFAEGDRLVVEVTTRTVSEGVKLIARYGQPWQSQ